ncbi:MAG: dihydroorotase [Hornefia sp.]|nr:dihydroorotase [Hornefia sp.]
MALLLKNATVYLNKLFQRADILVTADKLFVFDKSANYNEPIESVIDLENKFILPGFADVHVHFREPGFSYKGTIRTGSLAAAKGGYTHVCTMPNLNPPPSTMENLQKQLDIIERDSCINITPYGTITMKQDGQSTLSDMEKLAPYVCAFSDDGRGVQTKALMEDAMKTAKSLGKLIVAHCEDETLLGGSAIHDGKLAKLMGIRGISSESEWRQVERDVELAAKTGCGYHVCHVSTKETVEIIRQAKKSGVDVTCETAPHYLLMCDMDLEDLGRFKMNPPIRDSSDKEALREGICDGTVDMIATDHAPHSEAEKSKGLLKSAFGIVGLETAFPLLYTNLVKNDKIITLEKLIQLMAENPRKRFGIPGGEIRQGAPSQLSVWDLNAVCTIDSNDFADLGKATPFEGWTVSGKLQMTVSNGKTAYVEKGLI